MYHFPHSLLVYTMSKQQQMLLLGEICRKTAKATGKYDNKISHQVVCGGYLRKIYVKTQTKTHFLSCKCVNWPRA